MTITTFVEDAPEQQVIAAWAGSVSNIPSGWLLCDGNNGTPDLRDRFVAGMAQPTNTPRGTHGQASYTISSSQMPSHNHPESVGTAGQHAHTIRDDADYVRWNNNTTPAEILNSPGDTKHSTSSDGNHSHTPPSLSNTGSGASVDNRPLFYQVAYIVKA